MRAIGTGQCLGAQPQAARRQRLDRGDVEHVDRIHRTLLCQQTFGLQQGMAGGVFGGQALQILVDRGVVVARLRAAHRSDQGDSTYFLVFGGAGQQLFRTLPVALFMGLQALGQARTALLAAVAAPGAERRGQQAPQQPQHQQTHQHHQGDLRHGGAVVGAAVAVDHFAELPQLFGAEPL